MRPAVTFSFPAILSSEGKEPAPLGVPAGADPARLSRLVALHFDAVWRAVRRFGVPDSAAEDAAQEVFMVFSRKLPGIREGEELRYLFGVAMRIAANRRRAIAARREVADNDAVLGAASPAPLADALLEERRLRELLDLALGQLSDELRTTLVLFEIEGFSEKEIAATCGIPLGTVASRLRRARQAFHQAVEQMRARVEVAP